MGNAILSIILEGKNKTSAAVNEAKGGLEGLRTTVGNFGRDAMGLGLKVSAGITTPLMLMGAKAVSAASDLQESMSKVGIVFGENATEITNWSTNAATAFGITQQQALESAGTFGNLFSAMGIGNDASTDMSMGLVQLASDLASFNNIDPTEALEKLRAGLVGEAEPLRTLGVNLTAAATEARAMAMGLAGSTDELTPAMLAQARYSLIMEQSALAQGDFARTSEGLANQTRIVKAQLGDLAAQIGTALLPFVTQAVQFISGLVTKFMEMDAPVRNAILVIAGLAAAAGPVVMVLGAVATGLGALLSPVGLVVAAIAALAAAWATDFGGIRTTVTEFWNTHLKPIFDTLVAWLQENIPVALQTLANFWENVLKPAIETVWEFLEQYIFPVIETLVNVWFAALKLELELLAGFWENVLKPAIEVVWDFLSTYVIPIIEQIINETFADLKVVIEELAKFWRETLKPAIETVWRIIVEQLIPGLVDLKAKIEGVVRRALETAKRLFDDIAGAVNAVKDAVSSVIDWFNRMKDAISNWSPPAWVSSLGNTIAGIAGGLGHAAEGAEQFGSALSGLAPVAEDVQKLAAALLAMVNALSAVGGYGTAAVGPNLQRLIDQFGAVIRKLERAAAEWSGAGLTAAVTLAEAMGKIGNGLKAAATGLEEVAGYTEAKVGPALQRLIDQYGAVIRKLVRAAAEFDELGYQAAERFAAAMGAIGGKLKAAVEGLTAVSLYGASRIGPSIDKFVTDAALLVDRLAVAATKFEADGLAAAVAFAQAAGGIGSELAAAVEGLLAVGGYGGSRNWPARMQAFVDDLMAMVTALASGLGGLQMRLEVINAAAAFAEPIGRLVGVVRAGVDALAALWTYTGGAARGGITLQARRFVRDLMDLAEELRRGLGRLGDDLLPAYTGAVEFADRIGRLVGVVKPGMDAVLAMAAYVQATNLAQAVASFSADVLVVAEGLRLAFGSLPQATLESYDEAVEFAGRIQALVGFIQPAMAALQELSRYGGGAATALHAGMEKLTRNVASLINFLSSHYQILGGEAVAQAQTFAESIVAIVSAIRRGLEEAAGIEGLNATYDGAFVVGQNWITGIVDGITSRLSDLTDLMAYIRGLFPSSPAQYGPWRDLPMGNEVTQRWLAGMSQELRRTSELERSLAGVRGMYAGLGSGAYVGSGGWGVGSGDGGGDVTVNLSMSGPFYIRQDADVEKLATAVGEVLARQAGLTRRMGQARR